MSRFALAALLVLLSALELVFGHSCIARDASTQSKVDLSNLQQKTFTMTQTTGSSAGTNFTFEVSLCTNSTPGMFLTCSPSGFINRFKVGSFTCDHTWSPIGASDNSTETVYAWDSEEQEYGGVISSKFATSPTSSHWSTLTVRCDPHAKDLESNATFTSERHTDGSLSVHLLFFTKLACGTGSGNHSSHNLTQAPQGTVAPATTAAPSPNTPVPSLKPIPHDDNIIFTAEFAQPFKASVFLGELNSIMGVAADEVSITNLGPRTAEFEFKGPKATFYAHSFYSTAARPELLLSSYGIQYLAAHGVPPPPTPLPTTEAPSTPQPPPNTSAPMTSTPTPSTAPPTSPAPSTPVPSLKPIPGVDNIRFTAGFAKPFNRHAFVSALSYTISNFKESELQINVYDPKTIEFEFTGSSAPQQAHQFYLIAAHPTTLLDDFGINYLVAVGVTPQPTAVPTTEAPPTPEPTPVPPATTEVPPPPPTPVPTNFTPNTSAPTTQVPTTTVAPLTVPPISPDDNIEFIVTFAHYNGDLFLRQVFEEYHITSRFVQARVVQAPNRVEFRFINNGTNNAKSAAHKFYDLSNDERLRIFGVLHIDHITLLKPPDDEGENATGKEIGIAAGVVVGFVFCCILFIFQRRRCARCCKGCMGCDEDDEKAELATVDLEKDLKNYRKIN